MIEVEKKFSLRSEDIPGLIADSQFISEQTFTDSYLDTPDFLLTLQNKWLRLRDNNFQFKFPSAGYPGQFSDLDLDEQIKKAVGIISADPLYTALKKHGFQEFCRMVTRRKKYRKDSFIIDIDQMDFGYVLGEIELVVDYESLVPAALDKIKAYAQEKDLILLPVRVKIFEYLKRNNQNLYQKLVASGIVQQS
jgi:adenylate cyclase class IV